ncbi:MAG: 30S ribosomal protein S3 [Kiritimatiellaceae bacterium TMED266]|jgi:small subunit ribosomal protein S3|nr:MAG: 30S ribosomal protein S3 [Kiritimatiellaceae bacterium TMED266]
MGQKVNPIGMRLALSRDWRSRWYAGKKEFGGLLKEDVELRKRVASKLEDAAVSDIYIERYANRVRVTIKTARPGLVIGRKGEDIDALRTELSRITKKEVYVEIAEVKKPDLDATLVAHNVAMQLERRVSHRRAMKRAQQLAMDGGALGFKITAGGRLNGAEIARSESYKEGKIPLHTLRANIDYGTAEANTVAGIIGIKVWICNETEKNG